MTADILDRIVALGQELARLQEAVPQRLLRAAWLLDRARRLAVRAWREVEG
jgi:hypothetical protein